MMHTIVLDKTPKKSLYFVAWFDFVSIPAFFKNHILYMSGGKKHNMHLEKCFFIHIERYVLFIVINIINF